MKQRTTGPAERRRRRTQMRRASIAVVAALAGSLGTVGAAAAQASTSHTNAAVKSKQQCHQDAWLAFPGAFDSQGDCVSSVVAPCPSAAASPPIPDASPAGLRPNHCP